MLQERYYLCTQKTTNQKLLLLTFMKDISSISLTMTETSRSIYTDGSVTVNIQTGNGSYVKKDRFTCYVYTEDYYPMCNSEESGEQLLKNGGAIDIEIQCQRIWLPGNYKLLVRDNMNKSLIRVGFQLDGLLKIKQCNPELCAEGSVDDILTSCIENTEISWDEVATALGASQLRKYALECNQFKKYNDLRKGLKGKELRSDRNMLIYTINKDWPIRTLEMLKKLCVPGTYFTHIDCSTLFTASTTTPNFALNEKLHDTTSQVYCLTNLGGLMSSNGKTVVKKMIDKMHEDGAKYYLWLCGNRQEIDSILEVHPLLREFFLRDNYLEQQSYTGFELVQAFFSELENENLEPTDEFKDVVSRTILKCHQDGNLASWSLDSVHRLVVQDVRPRYIKRTLGTIKNEGILPLTVDDIDLDLLRHTNSAFDESMKELYGMVGLNDIKQSIETMANQIRFYMKRREAGFRTTNDSSHHAIFTGNPGTGKTTVAKLIGKIYHSVGLLSKGEVVCVDRTRLIGRYVGETEDNMKTVLEEAQGNVLFIDEAYNLYDGADDHVDYGNHVLDSLLTVLAQPNPDMVIIFAGYEKEMEAMLNSNPGLTGRFAYKFRFDDYNAEQLMEIACNLFSHDEYVLTDEAREMLMDTIRETVSQRTKNFGNARWVKQFVCNGIIPAMANRILSTESNDYQHIEASDIRMAFEKFNPKVIELKSAYRRVAGFSA